MTLLPHLAFTLPFTGFFASLLFGIDLLEKPLYLAVALSGAALPDTTRAGSLMGRLFAPLTGRLQRFSPGGDPTHNLVALTAATMAWALAERLLSGTLTTATVFCLAYFGHLTLDMCAREGAPLLYPFNRNPFVLIGNPGLRLKPEDLRHGLAVVLACSLAAFILKPFFSKGLWTTFNQTFATIGHLHDEFMRSPAALRVHYRYRVGSEEKEGSGYCVESAADRATLLLDNGRWLRLNKWQMVIRQVLPERSAHRLIIDSLVFSGLRPDSLNRLLPGKHLLSLNVEGDSPFLASYDGQSREVSRFRQTYLDRAPSFSAPAPASGAASSGSLPQIRALYREWAFIQGGYQRRLQQYRQIRDSLALLHDQYRQTDHLPTRERLFETIHQLEEERPPEPEEEKLHEIRIRIRRLREEEAEMSAKAQPLPVEALLSGTIRWAIIE